MLCHYDNGVLSWTKLFLSGADVKMAFFWAIGSSMTQNFPTSHAVTKDRNSNKLNQF